MTAAAGYFFASKWHIDISILAALLIGTALIIASACVFNNYMDRGIDARMERTKKRALVSRAIGAKAAIIYGSILGILGLVAIAQTNALTFNIGILAFFSYVILYGFAKRKSVHGTLVGTVPGSASLVAGYTAYSNHLDMAVFLLFVIMLTWQMAHFYSIAMFRFNDYKAAKIPVNPVVRGTKNTKIQIVCYIVAFILACSALSVFDYAGLTFRVIMIALGTYWLWKGLTNFKMQDDTKWARSMFGLSLVVLLVFSAAISVGSVLP